MFFACFRKEILRNMLSARYTLVFALFIGLTFTATHIRTELYKKQAAFYAEDHRKYAALVDSAGNHWAIGNIGITHGSPPSAMGIFVAGLENEINRFITFYPSSSPMVMQRPFSLASFQYFMQLDMVFIINIVCSLLALLLVFDGVCGECEQGTLKVLLAGPLPRNVIILSKLAAGLFTLLVPLALAWTASVCYVLFAAGIPLTPDDTARLVWIIALSFLYISFFFALGMAVSCWVRRSATSLSICLFLWIIAVPAIPNLVPMAVQHILPIPPLVRIDAEKDAIGQQVRETLEPQIRAEIGSKYTDIFAANEEVQNRIVKEIVKRSEAVDRYYLSVIKRQLALDQLFSRVSPSAGFMYAATDLAGLGVRDFLALVEQADHYQHIYNDFWFKRNDQANALMQEYQSAMEKLQQQKEKNPDKILPALVPPDTRTLFRDYPKFDMRPASAAAAIQNAMADVVILCGITALALLLALVGFLRYEAL
jgi:ABC-type transport system involved in multi-copper enzyme maturation permease subunit